MPLRQARAPIGRRANKAQSTLEYAVVIVCVAAALIAMQIYMKRAVSGRLRQTSDDIGSQYEPTDTTGEMTKTVMRDINQTYESYRESTTGKTIGTKTETINNETTQEWGYEEVGAFGELFPPGEGSGTPPAGVGVTTPPAGVGVTTPPDGGSVTTPPDDGSGDRGGSLAIIH